MGYSKTIFLGDSFSFGGIQQNYVDLSTAAADIPIGSITYFDATQRPVNYAYVDLYVGSIYNFAAATNYLEANMNVTVYRGVDEDVALQIGIASFYTAASTQRSGFIFYGFTNIAAIVNKYSWLNVDLRGADAHANTLRLCDICPVLRVSVAG